MPPNEPHEPPAGPDGDPVAAAAAEWVVRRHDGDWSAQDAADWQRWRAEHPAHEAAYARAERLWAALDGFKAAPELLAPAPARAAGETAATPEHGGASPTPRRAPPRRRGSPWRHVLGAGGLALMAVVAVFTATGGEPMLALQADQRTAVGESRDLRLPDGSRVRLSADSAIAFQYSATERRIALLKGEAVFEAQSVSAAERRPFVVTAEAGSTRALGTRFLVERLATHTRVVGIEHRVAVSVAAAPQATTTLSPGEAVRYDASGVGVIETVSPQGLEAEAKGQLVFERARLDDVVARLNRYFAGHIAVRGDAVARREVSGVFPAADVEGAIAALQAELGLRVLRLPGVVLLY